ncbi:MAG: hypothetical protein C0592_03095 [Marinilabiliales bacterium]|nr:MAG: hypothetical protein C0592_03095 [Marinilabiliales bacterium]
MLKTLLYIVFIVSISLCGVNASAQDYSEIHKKYFRYKKRLDNFIVYGRGQGHAILSGIRNRDAWFNRDGVPNSGDEISTHTSITFGQSFTRTGFLLGALSLEYALFSRSGNMKEAVITLRQINDILAAFERCDNCESGPPWYGKDTLDGFYIREDVPAVLSDSMYEALNTQCSNKFLKDRINDNEFGVPAKIYQNQVECIDMYNDHIGFYYTYRFPNDPGITSFYERDEKARNYYTSQKFTSQDETIGALVGLTLCIEIIDDSATRNNAAEIALRMINYLTGYKSNGSTKWWRPQFPDGTMLGNFNGGEVRGFAFPLKLLALKIMEKTGLGSEFIGIEKAPFNPTYFEGAEITSVTAIGYDRYSALPFMTCQTLAMAGESRLFHSIEKELLYITNKYNWDTFFLLLYAAINHKKEAEISGLYNYSKLLQQLETAPANGPYNYSTGNAGGVNGWAAEFKWSSTVESQNGERAEGWKLGNFSGVDYLILHNLACYMLDDYRESFVHYCQNTPNLNQYE